MHNKQILLSLSLGLSFGTSVFMFMLAPKAIAGNFSDVSGSILTTSDLVGGAFAPGSNNRRISFQSDGIRAAVNQTAQEINSRLGSQSLPVTTPGVPAGNISPTAQNALAQLINQQNGNALNRNTTGQSETSLNNAGGASRPAEVPVNAADINAAASQIETSLINGGGASNPTTVRNLVSSLRGLTADNQVNPAKLQSAVVSYNDLIKSASDNYITNPPQELLAIDSILSYLVKASLTGQEVPIENNSPPAQPVTPPEIKLQPPSAPVTPVQPSQPSQPAEPAQPAQPRPRPHKPIIPQTW